MLYLMRNCPSSLILTTVDKNVTNQSTPGLHLSNPGEGERNADGHKSGGEYVAVLFGLQLPLTHNPFK